MAITFEVDQYLRNRDDVLEELKVHLQRSQQIMKAHADGKRRDVSFEVGDLVYLKLRPYRQVSVARRLNMKLAPRFYGPFEILERVGTVAYRLKLPDATIHPVFHVSQLKAAIGNHSADPFLLEGLTEDMTVICQPEDIMGTREASDGLEVLVRWAGLPPEEATWERANRIMEQFPAFHLEDKVRLWGGGSDTTRKRWGQIYQRRVGANKGDIPRT